MNIRVVKAAGSDGVRRLLVSLACALAIVLGMAASAAPVAAESLDAYRLGPGDRLKVTVFGHPQESGEFEVDGQGLIAYPLLGTVQARGRTLEELRAYLTKSLDEAFIVDPRVSIEILNYRPFYIYGEVNRAGSYPYVVGLTARRAVAIAGGFTRRARHSPVIRVRETIDGVDKDRVALDDPVFPGDIIEIERRLF